MQIKLPETTDLEVVIGDKTYNFDLIEINDKLYELQEESKNSDDWEQEWNSAFRLYLRQKYDLKLSFGQASYLANQIFLEADTLVKKLNQ